MLRMVSLTSDNFFHFFIDVYIAPTQLINNSVVFSSKVYLLCGKVLVKGNTRSCRVLITSANVQHEFIIIADVRGICKMECICFPTVTAAIHRRIRHFVRYTLVMCIIV